MRQTPNCAFVLSVEQGKLESQAILLVESLRQFGGAYSRCPVYAVSPRPSRQMSQASRKALAALGVDVIVESLMPVDEPYGTVARLAACDWAEKNLACEILVSLDDDLFFTGEPDFSLRESDVFARPPDLKGICTTGAGDPFDGYWQKIAQIAGVDYDAIPQMETTVDRISVKACYNGGMVAVRRRLGLFQKANSIFHLMRAHDLSPRQAGEVEVFASTGFVGAEASRWWGSAQAVLSLAATQLHARVTIAPAHYNVPAHLVKEAEMRGSPLNLKEAILVHYHWLLDKEYVGKDMLFYGSSALPAHILKWLRRKIPLQETVKRRIWPFR